jgi:hypothetical protein
MVCRSRRRDADRRYASRRHPVLPPASLVQRFGARLRLAVAARRLRSSGWRGQPKQVRLVNVATYGNSMRKLRETVILNRPMRTRLTVHGMAEK